MRKFTTILALAVVLAACGDDVPSDVEQDALERNQSREAGPNGDQHVCVPGFAEYTGYWVATSDGVEWRRSCSAFTEDVEQCSVDTCEANGSWLD